MATLSIVLPDYLADASKKAARRLSISRTQFIRQAISHELEHINAQFEQEAMVKSILAMKNSQDYLTESEEITEGLNSILPEPPPNFFRNNAASCGEQIMHTTNNSSLPK